MVPKELLRLKRKWYRALRRTSPRSPARSPSDRAAVRPRRLGKYHPRRSSGRVALLSVRALRLDLIGEGVVEVQLRGELVTLLGLGTVADFEVYMNGPALVPAGIDRREPRGAVLVRHLVAAQVRLPPGVESLGVVLDIRVLARRVSMPDVHHGAGQRAAGGDVAFVHPGDVERQI